MSLQLERKAQVKPPYVVPSMAEIAAIPWNGYTVASTFSGCGGSSLGYRMAGFRVAWANEFVPAAQETYRANAPETVLDCRDIRTVKADEILETINLKSGELDLFDGSPPCQAFSTAGQREKGWGKEKTYEHGAHQRNEELFDEYIRLLDGLQPRMFIAENVSGLVKGVAKGFFLRILAALKACGYRVVAKVLDAKWLGVPQSRPRVIFAGVRADFDEEPTHPSPLPYCYTVADALPHLIHVASGRSGFGTGTLLRTRPAPAIVASLQAPYSGHQVEERNSQPRRFTISEVKRLCGFPEDFALTGSYRQQWERLGNSVPPVMMAHIARSVSETLTLSAPQTVKVRKPKPTARTKREKRGK